MGETTQEARLIWLLEEVQSRRLGFGKAAELAGLPIAKFLLLTEEIGEIGKT